MPDPRELLASHVARLKKIGAKLKAAKDLSPEDIAFLEGQKPLQPSAFSLQPSFDSMANLAGALKVPLKLIKAAKKAGAPGFDGSRVYTGEFLPWLVHWLHSTSGLSKAEARAAILEDERIRKIKEENDRKAGLYLDKGAAVASLRDAGELLKGKMRATLEDEQPALIQHQPAAVIRTHNKELVDRLCREFQQAIEGLIKSSATK